MPAAYLHEVIADRALRESNVIIKEKYMSVYESGAQGPDVLFFNRQSAKLKRPEMELSGDLIHSKKCADFLTNLLKYAKDINAAMAYCYGFLTHYSADSVIHPYVYAMTQAQDMGRKIHVAHMQLEAEFDTWCHRQQGNEGIPRQATALNRLGKDKKTLISHILAKTALKTFPNCNVEEKEIHKCFDYMDQAIRILHSPNGIKYAIISFIEKLAGKQGYLTCHMVPRKLPEYDFLNLHKKQWEHPYRKGLIVNDSMPELIELAIAKSVRLMHHAKAYFDGSESIDGFISAAGNLDYSGAPMQKEALNQSNVG